jgi:hypothetical protein
MHIVGYGSTAYSVGTIWRGKGDLCTPGARLALLATPCHFTGDAMSLHWGGFARLALECGQFVIRHSLRISGVLDLVG